MPSESNIESVAFPVSVAMPVVLPGALFVFLGGLSPV